MNSGRETDAILLWLVIVGASMVLFAWMAEAVAANRSPAFDSAVRIAIHQHASPQETLLMRGISFFGSPDVMVPLVLVILAVLAGTGIRRQAILLITTLVGAALLESSLKLIFHRVRPEPFFGLAVPDSYAFPSGHAMVALCFYSALAWIISDQLATRWLRVVVWTVAALLIGLIGFSRIYLGVHYPSDVLGGYAAGALWMASLAKVRDWWRQHNASAEAAAKILTESAASSVTPVEAAFPFPDAGSHGHTKPHEDRA